MQLDPDARYFLVSFDQAERRRNAERARMVAQAPHGSRWRGGLVSVRANFAAWRGGLDRADRTLAVRPDVAAYGRTVVERRMAQGGVLRFLFGDDPRLRAAIDTAADLADQTGYVGELMSVLRAYFGERAVAVRIESWGTGSTLHVTAHLG
jgi:hypothetical protein